MNTEKLGPNARVLAFRDGTRVLISYETPVAAYVPGIGHLRTDKYHSRTTHGHVNTWLDRQGMGALDVRSVPQSRIDMLMEAL